MHHCIRVKIEIPEQEVGEPKPEPITDIASFEPQGDPQLNVILGYFFPADRSEEEVDGYSYEKGTIGI
ncbi:hypothetical protein SETIT_3G187800v2 [Setaria italica]|uniref:Uncharacterized protein n=1 Tax=Setaria italica TaxID=4555 RepID=A0A368QGI2_SETIT|nr:hypothetical protein SETIT_3G187800v2 [Setaria italica]